MKMFKTILLIIVCMTALLLTQCKSQAVTVQEEAQETNIIEQEMEMRNPAFAKAKTTFYKWSAGIQEGGTGIHMEFDWKVMPENLVMKDAFFRGLSASIQQGQKGYLAIFSFRQNQAQDVVMHNNPLQEAVNTPPPPKRRAFPVALEDNQVGVIYEENGQLVYTILNHLEEKPQVALPGAAPGVKGL